MSLMGGICTMSLVRGMCMYRSLVGGICTYRALVEGTCTHWLCGFDW